MTQDQRPRVYVVFWKDACVVTRGNFAEDREPGILQCSIGHLLGEFTDSHGKKFIRLVTTSSSETEGDYIEIPSGWVVRKFRYYRRGDLQ